MEEKGKAQSVTHAIEQLRNTLEQIQLPNIKHAIIVKEKIPRSERHLYNWEHPSGFLYHGSKREHAVQVGPERLPIRMLKPRDAKGYGWT